MSKLCQISPTWIDSVIGRVHCLTIQKAMISGGVKSLNFASKGITYMKVYLYGVFCLCLCVCTTTFALDGQTCDMQFNLQHQRRQPPHEKNLHLSFTPRCTSQCKPPCHFLPRHLWRKRWKHRHDHSTTPSVGSKHPSRCHRTTASLQRIDSALPGGWTCFLSQCEALGNFLKG